MAGNTSKENSLERTLSSSLEFTSGSLYSLLSLPIKLCIHFIYLHLEKGIVLGRISFFLNYVYLDAQTIIFPLCNPFPHSPQINHQLFNNFILTFDTFIWQSIIFRTEVSNALFTERPLPWQMSL